MLYTFWYKIICLLTGLCIIFWGYKLFIKGIFSQSGDVEGSWKDYKLIVKKAAPGTYFVLFGSLIIAATIYKGFSVDEPAGIATGINKHMHIPIDSFRKSGDTIKIK